MNKLTIIKKAAPLALLAVVMSGSAFAGNGNGNGKGPRVKGPKLSLDVNTTCELIPNEYASSADDFTDPVLIVKTVVDASGSGDNGIGDSSVVSKKAQAIAKKGRNSEFIGEEKDLMPTNVDPDDPNADPVTYTQYFDICDEYEDAYGEETRGLAPSDKAVSAVATIVVNDGENYTSFASKCENIDEDNPYTLDVDESLTPEDEDGIDQSNFDIGTGSDQYPVVCSIWQ